MKKYFANYLNILWKSRFAFFSDGFYEDSVCFNCLIHPGAQLGIAEFETELNIFTVHPGDKWIGFVNFRRLLLPSKKLFVGNRVKLEIKNIVFEKIHRYCLNCNLPQSRHLWPTRPAAIASIQCELDFLHPFDLSQVNLGVSFLVRT